MGTVKEILEFFVTFGIVDNIIACIFLNIITSKKIKYIPYFIIIFIGSVLKIFVVPILYQIILFTIFVFYNLMINKINIKNSMKITALLFLFMLITECVYVSLLEFLNFPIFLNDSNDINFIYIIPNKIILIFILMLIKILKEKRNKQWDFFGLVKTPKKK